MPPRKTRAKSHGKTVRRGVVVETVGRRVRVRDEEGERVCFLSGQRAVIGDVVQWVVARGEGGKLVGVDPRRTALRRMDGRGREQVVAANLAGIVVVQSVHTPAFRPALLDRYLVAAAEAGLDVALVLNKTDLGVPAEVEEHLALRAPYLELFRCSALENTGVDALSEYLAGRASDGPWAFVGGSGVGKTSLIARLLPDQDVGAIGHVSEFWGTGRHTTTNSVLLDLPGGGQIADSPGIRNFTPAGLTSETLRAYFPGVADLVCLYRDCLHRPDEEGCAAPDRIPPVLLQSYRRLLEDVLQVEERTRPR